MIEYGPSPLFGVEGNELIIDPNECRERTLPAFFSPSLSNIQSVPSLDAVLPISRLEARRNARLIKSGKLVKLPRISACLTNSSLSGSGFFEPTRSLSFDLGGPASLTRRKEPELFAESAVNGRED